MKVVVRLRNPARMARQASRGLFAAAIAIAVYCGLAVVESSRFQKVEHLQFERLLASRPEVHRPLLLPPDANGALIGRIDIPRLGLSVMVVEGAGIASLRHAVGHIAGTSLPGTLGNIGISGHRDTFFRPLRNIRQDDIITLTTLAGDYRYRVLSTRIVNPDDVGVLRPDGTEILTLVTCYPFYFVGFAPKRFIVRAARING